MSDWRSSAGYLVDLVMLLCGSCKLVKQDGVRCGCGYSEAVTHTDYFMGRDKTHAGELTDALRANASRFLPVLNRLVQDLPHHLRNVTVTSGWRPTAINTAAGGAPSSKHLICLACDLADPDGQIGAFLVSHEDILAKHDCAIEMPAYTPGWCHIQLGAPPSGRRVYQPYPGPPKQV